MKNVQSFSLITLATMSFGLLAMKPDYGNLKPKARPSLMRDEKVVVLPSTSIKSVKPTENELKCVSASLFKPTVADLRIALIKIHDNKTFLFKHLTDEEPKSIQQKITPTLQQLNLAFFSLNQDENYEEVQEGLNSSGEEDEAEEKIRFERAHYQYKKLTKITEENIAHLKLATLFTGKKYHQESPLALAAHGKESPFKPISTLTSPVDQKDESETEIEEDSILIQSRESHDVFSFLE